MYILLFLGSARKSSPPKPARLGARVSQACLKNIQRLYPEHQYEIIDPLDYELDPVFKPHFCFAKSKVPVHLDQLAKKIEKADAYIMISPEYNHSMSPALANLLNHFASSLFAYKPSCIVTYSAGQWGGTRAAQTMRTFLSELGCLPVSAMIHIPKAQTVFLEDASFVDQTQERFWNEYFARSFHQLIWWAQATINQKEKVDPHKLVGNFTRSPSQRNAP